MYRIELSPGDETAFRSIEELAVAIRRGIVTSRARIWHNASGKWLPIEFHPHYKIAASMQLTPADLVAGAPVQKLELLTLGELMDPPAPPAPPPAPAPPPRASLLPRVKRAPEPEPQFKRAPEPEPRFKRAPEPEPKPRKKAVAAKPRRNKSGRRTSRIALVGALLIGCAHLAITAGSAALPEEIAVLPRSHRRLVTAPTNTAQQGRPETTAAAVLPGLPMTSRPLSTESASQAATPSFEAFRPEPEPILEPAPSSGDIALPAPVSNDSLARKMVDSTGKKALKRLLKTIGGTPAQTETRAKR
jgi:hypothetical protein